MQEKREVPARQACVRRAVTAAVFVGLIAALGSAFQRAVAQAPANRRGPPVPRVAIDLATAPAWQLDLLPGIGASRAHAIISRRLRGEGALGDGPDLQTAEDLLDIPGIGPGILRDLLSDDLPVRVLLRGRPLRWARERRDPHADDPLAEPDAGP